MQPSKIHILSTRTLDEAATAKAGDLNICFNSFSFINVQPISADDLKIQLQQLAAQPVCAVFTSSNAVMSVAAQVRNANWNIFCVGGKTKELAIQAFGKEAIAGSAKNAGGLAECIIASGRVVKVVFFCGDQRLNELPENLISNGIQTEEIIVYTTVLTPVSIEKNYDGILFFSPSAVHSFFLMNTIPTNVVLFSIGKTTTAAIQSYCTNKIMTSEWPGTENLLSMVTHFYTASQQAE